MPRAPPPRSLAEAEAELGAPPEHVLGGHGPFVLDQIADLAPRRDRPRTAGPDRLATWQGRAARARVVRRSARAAARAACRERRRPPSAGRPRRRSGCGKSPPGSAAVAVHGLPLGAEETLDLLQHGFGEPAIGRDLAAEDVDDRRAVPRRRPSAHSRASLPAPSRRRRRRAGARRNRSRRYPRVAPAGEKYSLAAAQR